MKNMVNEKTKEYDTKHIHKLLDTYLELRGKYDASYGQPNRYRIKESYREIEQELWYRLENDYHYKGFVIKKGYCKDKLYLQVFTEESFEKSRQGFKEKNL